MIHILVLEEHQKGLILMENLDYMVLCTDKDCFMMKSDCDELGLKYIDLFGELVEDMDDEEIELMLYGEN